MTGRRCAVFLLSDLVKVADAPPLRDWQPGEFAELASGGPPMLVTGIGSEVRCAYENGRGEIVTVSFPAECLKLSVATVSRRLASQAFS